MRLGVSAIAIATMASAAHAASDKPLLAPPPAWVVPAALPAEQKAKDEAPVRILLQDQQVHFADGAITKYQETAIRIETAQGLAAGTVSLPWNPEIDTLTVHKLQIRRRATVIDVLANQRFTVVRREQNLENAVLDGVLTATVQPEGLQVGDVIDFATSVTRVDPALGGHYEDISGGWGVVPVDQARLRAQWPATADVQWRERGAMPPVVATQGKGAQLVTLLGHDLGPVVPPRGAPPRFNQARIVEFSDFKSWAALSALMAPLYAKAATLPADAKLNAEVARIAAASNDPKARAAAALDLVQSQVRYVFLGMNDGGLVPADAEMTWERRFGDCKGKTALLIALLHGLGIEAEPALVNSNGADGLDQHLPMAEWFDHVLVRATIAGRIYWLDGTRAGDSDIDAIRTPAFVWALPVEPSGATLVRLVQPPLDAPDSETTIRVDASAGLSVPAPIHVETVARGDGGTGMHLQLAPIVGDALDQTLKAYWRNQYDFVDVTAVSARYDAAHHVETLVMDGTAKMDWSYSRYETDGTGVGYTADFTRAPGPDADAPFAVDFPSYSKVTETIKLPGGGAGFSFSDGAAVDRTVAGVAYHRTASLVAGVATIETTARALVPEFPAIDAASAQAALRALAKQTVYVEQPTGYQATGKEIAAQLATTPATADAYISRGNVLLDARRFEEAISDFDHALALDPKSAWAFADRGMAHMWKGQAAIAEQDFAAAAAIDPDNYVVAHGRGVLAYQKGDLAAAMADFDKALAINDGDDFARNYRAIMLSLSGDDRKALAQAQAMIDKGQDSAPIQAVVARSLHNLGDFDRSIAATTKAIAGNRHDAQLYLLQANNYRSKGDRAQALAQADAVIAANPDDPFSHTVAGAIYNGNGETAKGMAQFDKAIALKPTPEAYLTRFHIRPKSDVAGRRADAAAALKLAPDLPDAIEAQAQVAADAGDHAAAIAALSRVLQKQPHNIELLVARGIENARSGDTTAADKDYDQARALATDSATLNNLCWRKATAGLSLASALADCDTALAKAPGDATIEDSRGFALLRLGRYAEAVTQYDAALALRPDQPESLYGRAVAEARSGEAAASARDRAAALKLRPEIATQFHGYGVDLDRDVAPTSTTMTIRTAAPPAS